MLQQLKLLISSIDKHCRTYYTKAMDKHSKTKGVNDNILEISPLMCVLPGGSCVDHNLDVSMPSPRARCGEVDAVSWQRCEEADVGSATRRRMQSCRGGREGRKAV